MQQYVEELFTPILYQPEIIYPRDNPFDPKDPFPDSLHLEPKNRVAVVGIIGSATGKVLHSITGLSIFPEGELLEEHKISEEGISLRVYHDSSKNIMYLQLLSLPDRNILDQKVSNCEDLEDHFTEWWNLAEHQSIKAMLMVFLISHFVILVEPGDSVRLSTLHTLQILQKTKQFMIGDIQNYFQNFSLFLPKGIIPAEKKKLIPGYYIPILYFVFSSPRTLPSDSKFEKQSSSSTKKKEKLSLEDKIRDNLEKQIRLLLKAYRLDRPISRDRDR